MSKLEKLIQELCPDGVEYRKIGDISIESKEKNKNREFSEVRTVTNESKLVRTSDYFDRNITSEDTSGYMVVRENMFVYNPSRINIGSIAYSTEKSPVILSPMYVVFFVPQNVLLNKFLLLYLKSGIGMHKIQSKVEPGARFRLPFNSLAKITIPVPPLEVQQEIVRILDSFTELTENLTTELTARKQQYEYYRDKLLTFEDGTVSYRNLDDCCSILDSKRKPVTKSAREFGEYPYYGANGIQDYVSDFIFNGTYILVGEDGSVITKNGTPVVTWASGKIWVNNHAHIIQENGTVNFRYLYYYLQVINIKPLIHGNIPKLTGKDFRALQIPIPSLETQQEIVNNLDHFDSLCSDLSNGLPAEIEARQKQYDYYRDKLLTFTESG